MPCAMTASDSRNQPPPLGLPEKHPDQGSEFSRCMGDEGKTSSALTICLLSRAVGQLQACSGDSEEGTETACDQDRASWEEAGVWEPTTVTDTLSGSI